ncbi:MAG: hypothetical protein HUU20_18160 [Pirellulales bacterium]|nr:hypothetical protein [Pirellulales bacterium]
MAKSFAPAVVIGLGGTGQQALIRIKKLFLEQSGRIPPCIKLLAFDTTADRETAYGPGGEKITFDDAEFCHMSVRSVADAIKNPHVDSWWIPYDPLNRSTVADGAGGIRQVGRLATFANIDLVVALLKNAFEQVRKAGLKDEMRKCGLELLESSSPQVFVVSSLAGGTGAGSFIDFSILSRALGGPNMFYTAFFVMPWVFRDVAKTCFENGYASLLELEKVNAASPEDPFVVDYTSSRRFSLEERPYHIVNLIDGKCRNGQWILSRQEIPAFVGESIFNSIGAVAKRYRQIADNVMTMITLALGKPEEWKGQQAIYSTTGISSIVYPAHRIHEKLTAEFACNLIGHAKAYLSGGQTPEQAPTSENVAKDFAAFLTTENLAADGGGLLKRIQEMPTLAYGFDDQQLGLDLRSDSLKDNLVRILNDWRAGVVRDWEKAKRDEEVFAAVGQAVSTWLKRIREYEQNKREGYPAGSYDQANQLLIDHWGEAVTAFTLAHKQLSSELAALEETTHRKEEEISRRAPKGWLASTNPVRNACRQYCEGVVSLMKARLALDRLNRATALSDTWREEAVGRDKELEKHKDALREVADTLENLRLRLQAQAERLTVANLLKQKPMLEIYVGAEETAGRGGSPAGAFFVREGYTNCTEAAAKDFAEFLKLHEIESPAWFIKRRDLEPLLLDFAYDKVRPATELSVCQVLKTLNEKDNTAIARLTEQAVRYSSQMLPIDENRLTGHADVITEFTAVGGVADDEGVREAILAGLPQSRISNVQNVWAETGDPYRLTFANYFSVIPLYVLTGIEEAREKYLMRVRPPAHTDKQFEFPLVDILPSDSVKLEALKILALATLKSTALVERLDLEKPKGDRRHYYRLNPAVFTAVDESELALPGVEGKFYSMYEHLCRDAHAPTRKRLRQALLDMSHKPEFSCETVRREIREVYDRFKEILKEQAFNKTITGMLYRQQMVYFRNLLEMAPQGFSIEKALDLKLSFKAKK